MCLYNISLFHIQRYLVCVLFFFKFSFHVFNLKKYFSFFPIDAFECVKVQSCSSIIHSFVWCRSNLHLCKLKVWGNSQMDHRLHLLVLLFLSFSLTCESWGWFSSSTKSHSNERSYGNQRSFRGTSAEFSIEAFNDPKGMKLLENAKNKMVGSNSCWQNAYQHLFAGCSEILAADEKRSRLAWHLSDCFQRDSGRASFPHCDSKTSIATCLRNLDDLAHKVYLEFYLETNSICYRLQLSVFALYQNYLSII